MSKTIYLIGLNGAFLHWCPGCLVRTERNDVIVARNPHGYRVDLCQFPYPESSKAPGEMFGEPGFLKAQEDRSTAYARTVRGCLASWQQAIISAPDGALLRWDDERQQVVDELSDDLESFADQVLADFSDYPIDRTELPCPGSAGGTVTIPSQEAKP